MKRSKQNTDGMEKIAELVDEIGVAMLTFADDSGTLTSRPMMALEMDAEGSLWFFTRPTPGKVEAQGKVNLAFARPDRASYVSISGRAVLLKDRAKIDELWSPMAKPWFPEGKDDPDLTLLRVDVDDAEYWDSNSSKMVRLLAMAVSAASGKPVGMGDNGKVSNPQFPSAVV